MVPPATGGTTNKIKITVTTEADSVEEASTQYSGSSLNLEVKEWAAQFKYSPPSSFMVRLMGAPHRWRRGIAPIIIGIAAIIFSILAALIVGLAPTIASMLLNAFGGERGVYFFLIQIPTADMDNPGVLTAPIVKLSNLLRNTALIFFTVLLVIAGMYYALEGFRVVSQGTAASIITGSIFTALMIYLFLPIYNVAASLLNTLTSPDQGYILSSGMIENLLGWAIHAPKSSSPADQTVAFLLSVFFLVMVAATLISIGILGILRIFFIGALAAMTPILLILRLIPATKRIAESFIDMLIGMMLSSLIAAIFIRFGYEALSTGSFTGLAGSIVAWGTLIAASMMPTVLAPRLGSLFMTTAGIATAAISTATIGTTGTISGTVLGAALGAKAIRELGHAGMDWKARAGSLLRTVGYAAGPFITGALTGRFTGTIPTIGGIPSLRGAAAAASESRRHVTAHLNMLLEKRAGTVAEALISALPFIKASPLASEADGLKWKEEIMGMSDEEAGEMLRESLPENKMPKRYSQRIGRAFKSMITKAPPILVSSIIAKLKDMKENEMIRKAFMEKALRELNENREKLRKHGYPTPDIPKEADATPTFMRDIFRYGGETARIVNAKLFHGALHHYNPKMPLEEARNAADKFVKSVFIDPETGGKRTDEKIAEVLAGKVGIKNLTAEEKRAFGHAAKQYLNTLKRDAPRILAAAWKATSDPKWTERVKSPSFTEAALKRVESGELQSRMAGIALDHLREMGAEKASRISAETEERERLIRDAMRSIFTVEHQTSSRAPQKYTHQKPRGDAEAYSSSSNWRETLKRYMRKKKYQGED